MIADVNYHIYALNFHCNAMDIDKNRTLTRRRNFIKKDGKWCGYEKDTHTRTQIIPCALA